MNNLSDNQYGIFSKNDFANLSNGALPSSFIEPNTGIRWTTIGSTPTQVEIKESNGVKILNCKTAHGRIANTDGLISSINNNFRFVDLQVEMNILIPNIKVDNVYFNLDSSTSQNFYFNIKNTFKNGLQIVCNGRSISCNFLFKNDTVYNIVITKIGSTYSFMIDGLIIGTCVSSSFTNNIPAFAANQLTIGGIRPAATSTSSDFIGEISNINMSITTLKYNNSFTKYGDNLLSRYNFDNLAVTETSTGYVCTVEAVTIPRLTWTLTNNTFEYLNGWMKKNKTSFSSLLPNISTINFYMYNTNNHNIDLLNLNDKYYLKYECVRFGNVEPVVTVDSYTKSALDFENGVIDKIPSTIWNKGGTANLTSTNVIYGNNSFENKILSDNINTSSNVVSGNGNKFEIEFHVLVNKDQSQMNGLGGSSLPILSQYDSTNALRNGLYITSPHEVSYQSPFVFRPVNSNGSGLNNYYKGKIEPNTINKINLSYDGSATRLFKNDELINVYGGTYIHTYAKNYFMGALNADNTATKGLIDNINIFDGVAKTVRNKDSYTDNLIVDLSFDGENNSTNIVDNGTLNTIWTTVGNSKLSISQPFDGYSSLYLDGNGDYINTNNLNLDFGTNDLTITFSAMVISYTNQYQMIMSNNTSNKSYIVFWGDYVSNPNLARKITISIDSGILITSTFQYELNKIYKIDFVRKNKIFYLYINNILDGILDTSANFNLTESQSGIALGYRQSTGNADNYFTGYIKNFKIYKDIAILPNNPNGKINLKFENNVNDEYNNSTWVNTNVTYDQINSFKNFSAKFTGINTNLKANNTENFNYKGNFNINMNVIKTASTNQYPCILGAASTGWQVSGNKNPNISFHNSNGINLSFNNGTTEHSISTQAFNNVFYNYDLKRVDDTLFLTLNDVVRNSKNIDNAITNIPFNEGSGTYLGTAGWSVNNSQNFTGNIDDFNSYNENLTNDIILYKQGTSNRLITIEDECYNLSTQTYTASENTSYFLHDSPSVKNFVAEIKVYLKNDGLNSTGLVFRTKNDVIKLSNLGGNLGYYVLINGNNLLLGKGTNSSTATPVTLSNIAINSYADNNYHNMKIVVNESNIKVYLDGTLLINTDDTTHVIPSQLYLHYYISSTGFTSKVKSIKVWNIEETTLLYEKNWKSKVFVDQYFPTIHYPFETNLSNIGYASLTQSNSGTFNASNINGKKCIQFGTGNYIQITSDNRSLYKFKSNFYIEFNIYPTLDQYHVILSNGAPSESGNPNLCTITLSNFTGILNGKLYMFLNGYSDPKTNTAISSSNQYILNEWNNVKIYREADQLTVELNGVKTTYTYSAVINFQYNGFTRIGTPNYSVSNNITGYLSQFVIINGVSKIPDDFDKFCVIDVDFKPTNRSYLFKDNAHKNVLHNMNIHNRSYLNSRYACSFNGVDQFIQLGYQPMFNFNSDDFVFRIDFEWNGSTNNFGCLIANGSSTSSNMDYLMVTLNNKLTMRASNVEVLSESDNIVINNGYNKVVLCRNGTTLDIYVNDSLIITKNISSQFNLNLSNNTYIGKNNWDGVNGLFKGFIYKLLSYRNTTNLSLLDDVFSGINEKYILTNGIDNIVTEFNNIGEHKIDIINDVDKISVKIDERLIEVNKDSDVSNVVLFDGYNGDLKDLRVYDMAFYDDDIYQGSPLIDTQYPEIEIIDILQDNIIYDIGDSDIKGFIEGYTDRKFQIVNRVKDYILYSGIEDYEIQNIEIGYIDEFEIHDLVNDQRYPLYTHEMVKGYIGGSVNLKNCGVKFVDMKVYCYRNDNSRLIGVYDLNEDGTYTIPNLDVNSFYDIVFKDQNRKIENISSSYRNPKAY